MEVLLTERDVRVRLRIECEEAGSAKRWAELNGVSPQYVSDALKGNRRIGAKILDALNMEYAPRYIARPANPQPGDDDT